MQVHGQGRHKGCGEYQQGDWARPCGEAHARPCFTWCISFDRRCSFGSPLPSWWQRGWLPTLCSHRQLQGLIGLQGMNPVEQTAIDNKMKELDGTENKAKLGANAILAVSLAVAKVPCMACHVPGCSQSSALSSPDWSDCNRRD